MKISDLKKIIDEAYKYAPEAGIEVAFKRKTYELARISQSGILGSLYIEVGEVIWDEDKAFPNLKS